MSIRNQTSRRRAFLERIAALVVIFSVLSTVLFVGSADAQLTCLGETVTVNIAAGDEPTSSADVILGTAGNDIIAGLGGADRICGGDGDDDLRGSGGDDIIEGGAGNDVLNGQSGADQLYGGGGDDNLRGGDGDDLLDGGPGQDRLTGQNDHDNLLGGAGDDELFGQDGDDVLDGQQGADILHGGPGDDTVLGGSGNDVLFGQPGADELRGGSDADELSGGSGDDALFGGTGDDSLYGNTGSDTLYGGAGDDFLSGGDGADRLNGGDGTNQGSGGPGNDNCTDPAATNCEGNPGDQQPPSAPLATNPDGSYNIDTPQSVDYRRLAEDGCALLPDIPNRILHPGDNIPRAFYDGEGARDGLLGYMFASTPYLPVGHGYIAPDSTPGTIGYQFSPFDAGASIHASNRGPLVDEFMIPETVRSVAELEWRHVEHPQGKFYPIFVDNIFPPPGFGFFYEAYLVTVMRKFSFPSHPAEDPEPTPCTEAIPADAFWNGNPHIDFAWKAVGASFEVGLEAAMIAGQEYVIGNVPGAACFALVTASDPSIRDWGECGLVGLTGISRGTRFESPVALLSDSNGVYASIFNLPDFEYEPEINLGPGDFFPIERIPDDATNVQVDGLTGKPATYLDTDGELHDVRTAYQLEQRSAHIVGDASGQTIALGIAADVEAAATAGHFGLDVTDWSHDLNDAFVNEIINTNHPIRIVSDPDDPANLWLDYPSGSTEPTAFATALELLSDANVPIVYDPLL